ncbi:MAG: GIY-YIG nuclease family protein [Defluviitaleaceae bacterium]|nr:GIY-YIG nuclease family protein [Defluviitaleaceae bacterium]MCL2275463.1 GIY-YIG nuclease family protein [Defluviitaleaceae bacterium]
MASKNFTYFLMDDVPNGRVKCTFANWTGVAYRIPRIDLNKCKDRPDLQQSGIYFLFGIDEVTDEQVVYVGQADVRKNGSGLLGRLIEHRNKLESDYWTEAVVFTTKDKDNWLGATEISWLENHFCTLAKNAKRYVIKNNNEPAAGKPTEEEISDLEEFAKNAAIIMGVLSHRVFEPKAIQKTENDSVVTDIVKPQIYEINTNKDNNNKGVNVKGCETSDGFVLFKGGKIKLEVAESLRYSIKRLRDTLADKYDKEGILLEDLLMRSPNEAANFATGYPVNAQIYWKTPDGVTLKDFTSMD